MAHYGTELDNKKIQLLRYELLKSPGCALKVGDHYAGLVITVAVTDMAAVEHEFA